LHSRGSFSALTALQLQQSPASIGETLLRSLGLRAFSSLPFFVARQWPSAGQTHEAAPLEIDSMKSANLIATAAVSLACSLALAQSPAPAASASANPLATARVFRFEEMPVHVASNGSESRAIFNGTLATGESVGAHETTQPAGATPSPLHPIQHSELIVIRQGTVAFEHDGKSELVGPGGIIYVALGTVHHLRNAGDGPASYVVIQIGGDTKK
jgi:mannose-6-phosphate isomerase-like protein (cupin superfamily)